jgi:SAM-dependent methyltransferase
MAENSEPRADARRGETVYPGPLATPPDNRAAWNAIADAYQTRERGNWDVLGWGIWCPDEPELSVIGDVRGKRALVVGCGGGEDIVALNAMGATNLAGIDLSDRELEHARRHLAERNVQARLVQGTAEDLSAFPDAAFDLAVSVHALLYVERIDRCFAEVFRVLAPGGLFAFSVQHPFDTMTSEDLPVTVQRSYFEGQEDWEWDFPEHGVRADFRSWSRPVSEWFAALQTAGFTVERILEPAPPPFREPDTYFEQRYSYEKVRLVPQTLIYAARKVAVNGVVSG